MRKPILKRMTIMLVIVGCVFAAIIAYQMFVASMMKKYLAANTKPTATVTAIEVKKELWQPQVVAVGTLRAIQGVDISSEVAGIVEKLHFVSGNEVKQGDLLLELNTREEVAKLKALQASSRLAEINYERDKRQLKVRAISEAQLDASRAEVLNRKAQEAQQQAIIDKKIIRAPFSGRLGVSQISAGQFIAPAEKIVPLQDTSSLYIDFYVPQKYLAMLKTGLNLHVISKDPNGDETTTIIGRISTINSVVDKNTRNVLVEGIIDNKEGYLISGMFVNVKIDIGEAKELLTLPQTALSFNAYGTTVFVARKDEKEKDKLIAQQLFVKTGDKRGDQVAILDGIEEGDLIVTSGQLKLKNDTPLKIDNSVLPENEIAPTPQER